MKAPPNVTELEPAGLAAAAGWRISGQRPKRPGGTPRRWREMQEALGIALGERRRSGDPLAEAARLLHSSLWESRHAALRLPHAPHVERDGQILPRVYLLAGAYLDAVHDVYAAQTLIPFTDGAQQAQPLDMGEIWALRSMLQLRLIERAVDALPAAGATFATLVASLRAIGETLWLEIFERLSVVERVLRQDPAGVYPDMDADSRDVCRGEIERLAHRTIRDEVYVAERAVGLARSAATRPVSDARVQGRRTHVGFYLLDRGVVELRHEIRYRPAADRWLVETALAAPGAFYMGGVLLLTALLVTLVLVFMLSYRASVLGAVLLVPLALQAAVEIMNGLATLVVPPRIVPKLDFSDGIPDDCATMVAVPTLLLDADQVRRLVDELEVRFLANRDRNLHFALLTDPPDATTEVDARDRLADLAAELITALNLKYAAECRGSFFLFHRRRVYNPGERAWMGWERKRGKLLDLNRLLRADYDSFPVKRGDLSILPQIAYVLTLDADTQLPPGSAHRLVGAIAHPLNRAVIDPVRNVVVDGYGILQPRVGVSVASALRSRLASIYSGQTGFDLYTRAVSDVYQDLFAEGTFTGKGIYEVDVLRAVLEHRFPANALLSHDLIEGAYARAALASDIEVIDDYPSHYSAYNRRKHRWVRGDWQAARWLLPRVPDYYDRLIPNPINGLSRWKIYDNLRRSMLEPFTLVLLAAGWLVLLGTAGTWTLATLTLIALPAYVLCVFDLLRIRRFGEIKPRVWSALAALARAHAGIVLHIAFLAHQTLILTDAVGRSLVRSFITKRKLLEWETAAQVERDATRRTPIDRYLDAMPALMVLLAVAIFWLSPASLPVAAPILALWAASKPVAKWLNGSPRPAGSELSPAARDFLRDIALGTWRFFRDYGGAEHGWLVPDNVQLAPALVAHRTSPTNLGLLLNARLAALELGYLTLPEAAAATRGTLTAIERLERAHGHLFNWYDTQSGAPLEPRFISTVDSGNLAGCCWTLAEAVRDIARRPLFGSALWLGVADHLRAAGPAGAGLRQRLADQDDDITRRLSELWLLELDATGPGLTETAGRLRAIRELTETYAPWLLPDWPTGSTEWPLPGPHEVIPADMPARLTAALADAAVRGVAPETCARLEAVAQAHRELVASLGAIAACAERLVAQMDFRPLFNPRRRLLSVGLDPERGTREVSCYDLLASEARMAGFVAIAKGDVPVESWFRYGRPLVVAEGVSGLLSWSGTMFEYLMPALWMRAYPDTLLERSAHAAVAVQERYGSARGVPWGVSESGYAERDAAGAYQYHAFGVRALRLRLDADDRLVIAPYATCLALGVSPQIAIANLHRMAGLGWVGHYGFFEAADYAGDGEPKHEPELIRSWMAHHQGMSLLGICNALAGTPFQRWFHASLRVQAVELLLQEKVPAAAATTAVRATAKRPRNRRASGPTPAVRVPSAVAIVETRP